MSKWGRGDSNSGRKTPSLAGWSRLPYGPKERVLVLLLYLFTILPFLMNPYFAGNFVTILLSPRLAEYYIGS